MKNKDLLYELMEEINDTEADMIEKNLYDLEEESVDDVSLKRQESLVLDKIHAELGEQHLTEQTSKGKKASKRKINKRKFVVLVAAAVMMFSMIVYARVNEWDIEFAKLIGLNGAMEELDGGFVKIDKSVKKGDITITAVQSIGDKNNQWIQFDTDVPWTIGESEEEYYMFEDVDIELNKLFGRAEGCSAMWYCYNNNGNVSLLLQLSEKDINRLNVNIKLKNLYQCNDADENSEDILVSGETWEFEWKNYYSSNTITRHPKTKIDDLTIDTIEVTPISIRVEATGSYSESDSERLWVDEITLSDGTIIPCIEEGGGCRDGMYMHKEYFYGENLDDYENYKCIDVDEIVSVTINGEEIEIK